jgi:hypothetical protein
VQDINFHQSNFQNKRFFAINIGSSLEQSLPEGLLQIQPLLGKHLNSFSQRYKRAQ